MPGDEGSVALNESGRNVLLLAKRRLSLQHESNHGLGGTPSPHHGASTTGASAAIDGVRSVPPLTAYDFGRRTAMAGGDGCSTARTANGSISMAGKGSSDLASEQQGNGSGGALPIAIKKRSLPSMRLMSPTVDGYTVSHSQLVRNLPTYVAHTLLAKGEEARKGMRKPWAPLLTSRPANLATPMGSSSMSALA